MNNLQKSLLTALLSWAGVGGMGVVVPVLKGIVWNLSYALPNALITPTLLLPVFLWVALIGWGIWRIWQ